VPLHWVTVSTALLLTQPFSQEASLEAEGFLRSYDSLSLNSTACAVSLESWIYRQENLTIGYTNYVCSNICRDITLEEIIKDYEDFLWFTKVDTFVRKSPKRGSFDWDFSIRNQDFQKFSVF